MGMEEAEFALFLMGVKVGVAAVVVPLIFFLLGARFMGKRP